VEQPLAKTSFGPTSGMVSGSIGLVMLAVVLVMAVFQHHTIGGLRIALAALLGGVLVWAFLLRSRVVLRPETVELRNAFRDHLVPYRLIDGVQIRAVTCLFVGEKKYIGAGVGHPVKTVVRRASGQQPNEPDPVRRGQLPPSAVPDFLEQQIRERVRLAAPDPGAHVITRLAWLEAAATVILAGALVLTFVLGS
jgi:hypothetical protein